jgi:hypothetical protein
MDIRELIPAITVGNFGNSMYNTDIFGLNESVNPAIILSVPLKSYLNCYF